RCSFEVQEDRTATAERYARRLLTLGPDGEVQGYLWLGNSKALHGRFGEAFRFWERGNEISARRPTGWSQMAVICAMASRRNHVLTALELGDQAALTQSADALTRWVQTRPWNLAYRSSGFMLAHIARWRAGATRPFADTGRAFKMVSPYHRVHALYRLAQVYEREKRASEARELYERFVAAWGEADRALPDVADARRRLGK